MPHRSRLCDALDGEPIDVLIANAGLRSISRPKPIEVTREDFFAAGDERLCSARAGSGAQAQYPRWRAEDRDRMSSLMSSISANDWGHNIPIALRRPHSTALWRQLAQRWAPVGIHLYPSAPGLVATQMTASNGLAGRGERSGHEGVVER